jgi:hypothetical protein
VPKTGKRENGGGGTRTEKSTAASHCRPGMAYSRRSTEPIRIQYRRSSQKTVSAVTRRLSGATCLRRFGGVFFLRLGAVFASRNAAAGSLPLHSAARGALRSFPRRLGRARPAEPDYAGLPGECWIPVPLPPPVVPCLTFSDVFRPPTKPNNHELRAQTLRTATSD